MNYSTSENHGIDLLTEHDLKVYSVGISTGGVAEMRMAQDAPRHIVATTIDKNGLEYAYERIYEQGFGDRIELKYEDISKPLPYDDNYFDYVYARLVLHYLPKDELSYALSGLYRVIRPGGRVFAVVRSDACEHAHMPDSVYDPSTRLTEYTETNQDGTAKRLKRQFMSQDSLLAYVMQAGFEVEYVTSFEDRLFKDFMRTVPDTRTDNLVELLGIKPL